MIKMNYKIEAIRPEYDAAICNVIKLVGAEFAALDEGFGPSDAEVFCMSRHYNDQNRSRYLVITVEDQVAGGCGISTFAHHQEICELRKLFLLPEYRGFGLGRILTEQCLDYAVSIGYSQCYLDTLSSMEAAIGLYKKLGFSFLKKPFDGTFHASCDVWMLKDL